MAGSVAQAMKDLYRLPVRVSGVNYNWDAGQWRPGQTVEAVEVFEGGRLGAPRRYQGRRVLPG